MDEFNEWKINGTGLTFNEFKEQGYIVVPPKYRKYEEGGFRTPTGRVELYSTILERKPLPIHKTSIPNLDIVPSHILLSNTDIELTTAKDHREARLKAQLDQVKQNYDYVLIDCPPALSWLTINAFTASDQVLVVVSPGYFELDSIVQLNKTMDEVRAEAELTAMLEALDVNKHRVPEAGD